ISVIVAVPVVVAITISAVIAIVVAAIIAVVAPLAVAAVNDLKIRATAAIDPNALAIVTPRAAVDAVRLAALADDENAVVGVDRAAVAAHVARRAIEQCRRAGVPVSGDAEARAAAAVHPHTARAVAPGLPHHARRFAALSNQPHTCAGIHRAPSAIHVIRRAVDVEVLAPAVEPDRADLEVRAAAAIDPDAAVVIAPGAFGDALGFTALPGEFDSAASIDGAPMAAHVVRGARYGFGLGRRCRS